MRQIRKNTIMGVMAGFAFVGLTIGEVSAVLPNDEAFVFTAEQDFNLTSHDGTEFSFETGEQFEATVAKENFGRDGIWEVLKIAEGDKVYTFRMEPLYNINQRATIAMLEGPSIEVSDAFIHVERDEISAEPVATNVPVRRRAGQWRIADEYRVKEEVSASINEHNDVLAISEPRVITSNEFRSRRWENGRPQ